MALVKVSVKWGKETYEVSVDPTASALTLKETLYKITGVPVDRCKLTAKDCWKGTLKDEDTLANVKEGAKMALMGTSVGIPESSGAKEVIFVEDLSTEAAAKIGAIAPPGLENLGNTCYMNSTLQCLKHVPEIKEALSAFRPVGGKEGQLADGLSRLYKQLDNSGRAVVPQGFVTTLRTGWSLFNESVQGRYKQQDAEEFLQTITQVLASQLKEATPSLPSLEGKANLIDALFEIQFEETMTNVEAEGEAPVIKPAFTRKLICNFEELNASEKVTDITMGIRLGLGGTVEKFSDVLGRNSVWKKQAAISQLPRYICVQMMRFFWKATPNSMDHAGVPCKILKPVNFPMELDMYEFCSKDVQTKLKVHRDKEAEKRLGGLMKGGATESKGGEKGDAMDIEESAALEEALKLSMGDGSSAGVGLPADFKGRYELFAAVTHKGRSSDSGHYIGWGCQDKEKDEWMCYDDNEVHPCKSEHIMELKGGGDYDMAYLLFYRFAK